MHSLRMLRFAPNNSSAGHSSCAFWLWHCGAPRCVRIAVPCLARSDGHAIVVCVAADPRWHSHLCAWHAASRGTAALHLLAVMSARQPFLLIISSISLLWEDCYCRDALPRQTVEHTFSVDEVCVARPTFGFMNGHTHPGPTGPSPSTDSAI